MNAPARTNRAANPFAAAADEPRKHGCCVLPIAHAGESLHERLQGVIDHDTVRTQHRCCQKVLMV